MSFLSAVVRIRVTSRINHALGLNVARVNIAGRPKALPDAKNFLPSLPSHMTHMIRGPKKTWGSGTHKAAAEKRPNFQLKVDIELKGMCGHGIQRQQGR
jgi:hypothetical protein